MSSENEFLAELQNEFLQEVSDLLASTEESFLEFERDPGNRKELEAILRLFHNLKGSAAAVGFDQLSKFCHQIENFLVAIKNGKIRVESRHIDVLLKGNDRVRSFVAHLAKNRTASYDTSDVSAEIEAIMNGTPRPAAAASAPSAPATPVDSQKEKEIKELDLRLLEDFLSDANDQLETMDASLLALEKNPLEKEPLNGLFRAFHTMKSASAIVGIELMEHLAHDVEEILDHIRSDELVFSEEIANVCFEAVTLLRALTQAVKNGQLGHGSEEARKIELLRAKVAVLNHKKPPVAAPASGAAAAAAPPAGASSPKPDGDDGHGVAVKEGIKVDADRLDRLVDTIGELVIAEAMVAQSPELKRLNGRSELFAQLNQLNKIIRSLQQIGLSLRMVPVRPTFKKMARIVRDVSRKLGKRVEFEMYGDDTELDKTVLDKINDPLVHMVRNSVDHGIEKSEEDRLKAGKPPVGRVVLRAFQKAGSIWIEIEDDGKGLNKEVILKKAIEKGLVPANATLTDREIHNLVFLPGFSTAEAVTEVSGRGVGMDVVRRNIEDINGQIEIRSEPGKGSVFSIRIPNTLAIIDGMVILVGSERYVVPTHSIIRSVQPNPKDIHTVQGGKGEMVSVQGELIPLLRMSQYYNISGAIEDPTRGLILIVEEDGKKMGLLIDRIIRQQQFVTKGLGDIMRDVPGVAGGTIMSDGQVGLILDVGTIMKTVSQ